MASGDAAERNLISGNSVAGVWIDGQGTDGNVVAGELDRHDSLRGYGAVPTGPRTRTATSAATTAPPDFMIT